MNWLQKKLERLKKSLNPAIRCESGMRYIFWSQEEESWLEQFIKYRFPNISYDNISLISVFGKRHKLSRYGGCKIFYSGENIEPLINHSTIIANEDKGIRDFFHRIRCEYNDYMINDVSLSIGFKNCKKDNYLRLPLWIMYLIPANANYQSIKSIVDNINKMRSMDLNECVCVNRHDAYGLRKKICDDLESEMVITYAGKWRNSTTELWDNYDNDKLRYLNTFRFNICPENMDAQDYCSEKIFDALRCGCIPIYAGCNNAPEPGIINENFIIKWNLDGNNLENIKLIRRLKNDENFYQKWVEQDKLHPYAVEYIYDRMQKLEEKLKEIL